MKHFFVLSSLFFLTVAVPTMAEQYAERIPTEAEKLAKINKDFKTAKGKIVFDAQHSIEVQGSHYNPATRELIYQTPRSKAYDYHYRDPKTGANKVTKRAMVIREEAHVNLDKRDAQGRYLVTFPRDEGGPNSYWVPPSQLGLKATP